MRDFVIWFVIAFLAVACSGCSSVTGARDESLVEARIVNAVNAERSRWVKELSTELNSGLREAEQRIDAVSGGIEQIRFAAEEYRRLFLYTLERLQQIESQGIESD